MPATPTRGEVWIVDLGMVAKVRPCLVISISVDDDTDRMLTTPCHTPRAREVPAFRGSGQRSISQVRCV